MYKIVEADWNGLDEYCTQLEPLYATEAEAAKEMTLLTLMCKQDCISYWVTKHYTYEP